MEPIVSVLFARADSIYKQLPGCDVWDIERDARKWPGARHDVAHPPCRGWGRFSNFAKVRPDELALAFFALDSVRKYGGVLEHPAHSKFWNAARLPKPDEFRDEFGGYTIEVEQFHFGHLAEKKTWLYIVGSDELPAIPFRNGAPEYVIAPNRKKARDGRKCVTKKWREKTPTPFGKWLVELARRCHVTTEAAY